MPEKNLIVPHITAVLDIQAVYGSAVSGTLAVPRTTVMPVT
jgi:hypothetical protein